MAALSSHSVLWSYCARLVASSITAREKAILSIAQMHIRLLFRNGSYAWICCRLPMQLCVTHLSVSLVLPFPSLSIGLCSMFQCK